MMTENLNFCIRSFCLQLSKLHRHFDSKHHLPGHICGPNRMSDIPVCSLGATLSLKQSRRWKWLQKYSNIFHCNKKKDKLDSSVPFIVVFFFPLDFAKLLKTDFVWNNFNNQKRTNHFPLFFPFIFYLLFQFSYLWARDRAFLISPLLPKAQISSSGWHKACSSGDCKNTALAFSLAFISYLLPLKKKSPLLLLHDLSPPPFRPLLTPFLLILSFANVLAPLNSFSLCFWTLVKSHHRCNIFLSLQMVCLNFFL